LQNVLNFFKLKFFFNFPVSFTILVEGGQFTHKLYEQSSSFPSFLRHFVGDKELVLDEKSWNAFPYAKTVGTLWKIHYEIIEIYRPDDGTSKNVHKLDEQTLKATEVVEVNLTDPVKEKYNKDTDPL